MSSLEAVASKNLPGWENLSRSNQLDVCSALISYSFRHLTSSGLTARLLEIDPTLKVKPLRLAVMSNGYVLCNLKLFAYAQAVTGNINCRSFAVSGEDSRLVRRSLEKGAGLDQHLRGLAKAGYRPAGLPEMNSLVHFVLDQVDDYVGKFVHKKMRFIYQSQGLDPEDLKQDMLSWAVYSVYRAFPILDSRLHAVNIAKQVIHNQGINRIKASVTGSRQRLTSNSDGTFGSKMVSLDQVGPTAMIDLSGDYLCQCNHLVTSIDGKSAADETVVSVQDKFELKRSVSAIYRGVEDPKMRRLMKLWSGEWDSEFSSWLGEPNDEWFEKVTSTEYLVRCAKFLGIPGKDAKAFLLTLRFQLKDYQ